MLSTFWSRPVTLNPPVVACAMVGLLDRLHGAAGILRALVGQSRREGRGEIESGRGGVCERRRIVAGGTPSSGEQGAMRGLYPQPPNTRAIALTAASRRACERIMAASAVLWRRRDRPRHGAFLCDPVEVGLIGRRDGVVHDARQFVDGLAGLNLDLAILIDGCFDILR